MGQLDRGTCFLCLLRAPAVKEREKRGRKNLGKSDAATFVPSRPLGEERKGEGGQKWKKTEEEKEAGGKPSEEEETVNPVVEGEATINSLLPLSSIFSHFGNCCLPFFSPFPFFWSQRNCRCCATSDDFSLFGFLLL